MEKNYKLYLYISQWKLRTDIKQETINQEHREGELRRGHVLTLQGAYTFSMALHPESPWVLLQEEPSWSRWPSPG